MISDKNRDTSELLLFDTCIVVAKSKSKSRLDVVFAAPLEEVNLSQPQNFEPRLILTRNNYKRTFNITTKEHSDARKWVETFKLAKEAHELELNRIESDKNITFLSGTVRDKDAPIPENDDDLTEDGVEETDIGSVADSPGLDTVKRAQVRPKPDRPSSMGLLFNGLFKKEKNPNASPKPSRRHTIEGAENKSAIESAKSKFIGENLLENTTSGIFDISFQIKKFNLENW